MKIWFVEQDGEQVGPLSFEGLEDRVRNGMLKRESLVWNAGSDAWVRADQIGELSGLFDSCDPLSIVPPSLPRQYKASANYAWRRFLAKFVDVSLAMTLALALVCLLTPETYVSFLVLFFMLSASIWAGIEIASGCKTVGRQILGIKVEKLIDSASVFERTILLAVIGMGLEIPIISFLTKLVAYFRFRKTGTTFWDRDKFKVVFSNCGIERWGIAITILVVAGVSQSFLGSLNGQRITGQKLSEEIHSSVVEKMPSATSNAPTTDPKTHTLLLSRWDPVKKIAFPAGEFRVPIYSDVSIDQNEPYLHGPRGSFVIYYRVFNLPTVLGKRTIKNVEDWSDYNFDRDFKTKQTQSVLVLQRKPEIDVASYETISRYEGFPLETDYYFGKGSQMYMVNIYYSMSTPVGNALGCDQLNVLLQSLGAPALKNWPRVGFTDYCTQSSSGR